MAGTEKVRQQEEVLGGSKSKFRHQWGKYKQTGGKESWVSGVWREERLGIWSPDLPYCCCIVLSVMQIVTVAHCYTAFTLGLLLH